jgi:hypothetical protein
MKERGLAGTEERQHSQPAKEDVKPRQVHTSLRILGELRCRFIWMSRSSITRCSSRFRLRTPMSDNAIVSLPAVVA